MYRWFSIFLVAVSAALASACEPYDRPHRPLPADFEMRRLGGELLGAEALRGRPWVIHLWVPR